MGDLRAASLIVAFGLCAWVLGSACVGELAKHDDPRVETWKDEATRLRGLEFIEPARFRWMRTDETRDIIRAELEATYGDEQARYRDAYVALGALPPNFDLVEGLLALYEEQLLGLYSPSKRTMYVLADSTAEYVGPVVVHELVHALQHQHFGRTFAVALELRRNDDLVSALGAAMEGDASLTMLGVEVGSPFRRDVSSAERMRTMFRTSLERPNGVMAQVPVLLRVGLVFPYAEGTVFAARRYVNGGNAALDRTLRNAPISTAELYFPGHDPPVEFLDLPRRALAERLAARGCELGSDNVAGALTLQALFEHHAGPADRETLTRTWRGDRFLHVACGTTWELVWFTRWSSNEAARDFAVRYRTIAVSIGELAPLSGTPQVVVDGRTALVVTPGVLDQVASVLEGTEIRSYRDFEAWLADACFPESPCPEPRR